MPDYWKIFCEEKDYPGLWPHWFKDQCAAVGFSPHDGWKMSGMSPRRRQGWTTVKNCLQQIKRGDWVLVQLKNNRVARIGEVIRNETDDDQWNYTVPPTTDRPFGGLGRRIAVRWDLNIGSTDPDIVVLLPKSAQLPPNLVVGTIKRLDTRLFDRIREAMKDQSNWVGLQDHFKLERSLSDWIATYPHRLEDGLMPHPNQKVREKVFKDRTRADVLLIDADGIPVLVECKQGAPTRENLTQLRRYMNQFRRLTPKDIARGILVHGGAATLRDDVRRQVEKDSSIKVVRYSLGVNFASCT